MSVIWENPYALAESIVQQRMTRGRLGLRPPVVVLTSGAMDPLHVGHLRCIQEAARLGDRLVVAVNSNRWLIAKKGYWFMPAEERAEIVAGLAGVDDVVVWDDGTPYVDGLIGLLVPDLFAKGGDRSTPEHVARCERDACERVGCRVVYGVGGTVKAQSSSELVRRAQQHGR